MDKNVFNLNKNENFNDKQETINITTIGFSLQFDLILSLTREQLTSYSINFDEINDLQNLRNIINENFISLINISSNNFLFNTILYINRTNKVKSNIKYIIPFVPAIYENISFMDDVIKNVLLKEGIIIAPLNLINKTAEINFIINLIENNNIISYKKFNVKNNSKYCENEDINNNNNNTLEYNKFDNVKNNNKNNKKNNNINKEDLLKTNHLLNSLNKCDYILTSIDNINNLSEIFEEKKSFEKIIEYLKLKKLCIIYDSSVINDFTKNIMSVSDIYFFDKNKIENFIFDKNNKDIDKKIIGFTNGIEQKENKKLKLIIIMDNFKSINIIQYDPTTQLIIQKFTEPILLYKIKSDLSNDEEENFIKNNFIYLKSVFIGAFISRLFYKKTFNTCLTASNISTQKVIKFLKNKKFCLKNYKIVVKKNLYHSKSIQNLRNNKMESQFILDGNNICEMNSKKEYNPINDINCISFFESINNRKFLYKQGFINKKGRILIDPDRVIKASEIKNKNRQNYIQKEMKTIYKMKTKNNLSQKLLQKLSIANDVKINKNNCNMQTFNELNKQKYNNGNYLPSLKRTKSDLIFGNKLYNKEIKNIKINFNIEKRYFNGINFMKIFYKSNYSIKNKRKNNKKIEFFNYKHKKYYNEST